jgi:hypothetical protein
MEIIIFLMILFMSLNFIYRVEIIIKDQIMLNKSVKKKKKKKIENFK